jgi:hypothetical protein
MAPKAWKVLSEFYKSQKKANEWRLLPLKIGRSKELF